jgi:hypothetical protein
VHTSFGRGVVCVFCAGALLTAGCSSSDDSSDTTSDSGANDSAAASEDAPSTGFDASLPEDSGADDAAQGVDSTVDAPTLKDSSPEGDAADASHVDAAPTADAGADASPDAAPDASSDASEDAGAMDGNAADTGAADAGGDAGALPANPVAIWEFQDVAGSATAVDSSGNGHNATLMGTAAIVAGGTYGNYLQIDGTLGAFADVTGGPLFDNSKSFTVSAWVYFPSFNYSYDELISADGANVSVFELQLAPLTLADGGSSYNAEAAFPTQDVATPGAFYYAFSTAQPSASAWYHIVGVYDLANTPGLLSLYVNGVLQSNAGDSTSTGANPVAAVGDFIIGAGKYNHLRTTGAVANYVGVRVYAEALSAAQVTTLYGLNGR